MIIPSEMWNPGIPVPLRYTQFNKPTLRVGLQGVQVLELRKLLNNWGVTVACCNDQFDLELEKAVRQFQRRFFLKEDGAVGAATWQALYTGSPVNMPVLRRGSDEPAVRLLQRALIVTKDYCGEIDGEFGEMTELAVCSFQKRYGLVIDGIVGACSWRALSKAVD
ncbi:MAG: peptidoglycan-binding protein [Scytolyngbya sp. HA4215-MV1]|jgi:peptidoglycan hydrolase-like protein with peptidoglycan-binding domain|nr:peptidoglycan-binding protein [Scytolyngbya sp. HA4215-MV1]